MEMVPVVSSIIEEVGYNPSLRTLEILFRSGAIYLYYFVPQDVADGLKKSDSPGTYFSKYIKRVYEISPDRRAEPASAISEEQKGKEMPKRLFKRDRVSQHHESIRITTDDVLPIGGAFDPARHIVHVPVARFVELDCDHCLRGLEALGVRVDRSKGSSAIDLARNIRATDAVSRQLRLRPVHRQRHPVRPRRRRVAAPRSPEPVIAGCYAAKKLGNGQLNVHFDDGIDSVRIGDWADRPYPVKKVGAGFLRIKTAVLKQMAKELELPCCRMADRYRLAVLPADDRAGRRRDPVPLRRLRLLLPAAADRDCAEGRHVVSDLPHRRLCLWRSKRPAGVSVDSIAQR